MELIGTLPGAPGACRLSLDGSRIGALSPASPGDANGVIVAPGFFDIQINGYGGRSFGSADPEALPYAVRALRRSGVLFFCPTVTTNSREQILASFRAMARARQDPEVAHAVPCFHLEGPYIGAEDGPRGAHALEHVRPPHWEEFQAFQEAAEGKIGIVTLAPEQPGALPFIERLAAAGVVPAIGHTGASPALIADAVRAGARLSTHLGNGSHAKIDRHVNYIWEQLANDALCASLIGDGHHLPPAVLKCMIRCKGVGRSILISDAVSLAGLPPGVYGEDGHQVELLPSGRVNLLGTPYLSGASLLLPKGIENAMRFAGVSLADAVRMATANPAELLGLQESMGEVAVGRSADLVLFRHDPETHAITVEAVVVRGRRISAAEMAR